jgi:Tfp pilus assembly protein PilF
MKKFSVILTIAASILSAAVSAQSVQDGIKDLYAQRYKGARTIFESALASNPNNIEATYWLGQTYLEMDDVAGAKAVYEKALLASANAPLLLVGMGQVELKENKIGEARQRFEAAITMTRGKKGDDPVILNAIGRAITSSYNVKEKTGGDINYAVEKLTQAVQRDPKNAEAFLNLGNAIRKAKPGEGGGDAFLNYQKAAEANPNFAAPYYRMAQLFQSQRNWELYEKYLNDAISKDPKFAPAYYDLYYYKLSKLDFAAAQDLASKYIANSDPDPQADHFKAQTSWAEKKYDDAINISKAIISKAGAQTKPRTYILLADSYLAKGDTASARPYIDEFFARAKPEDITPIHYRIKADIYSAVPGQEDAAYAAYTEAVKADTTLEGKVDLIKQGAALFKKKNLRVKEGDMLAQLLTVKPKPTINDYFDATRAYYFGEAYDKALEMATKMKENFPDEVYGYEWVFNAAKVLDSTYTQNKLLPAAIEYFQFSEKDTAKYKKNYLASAGFLLGYYANEAKDRVKAQEYLDKMLLVDPTNESLKKIDEQFKKSNKPAKSSGAIRSGKEGSVGLAGKKKLNESA